jgi:hypothetical protein
MVAFTRSATCRAFSHPDSTAIGATASAAPVTLTSALSELAYPNTFQERTGE